MHEYRELVNGNWSNSTAIFRGLIHYNHSELNSTDFISVFQDGLNYTMRRDCSVGFQLNNSNIMIYNKHFNIVT